MTCIKCSNCGYENLEDAKVCANCGKPLDPHESSPDGNYAPRKPRKWPIILAAFLIASIGAYFGFRNKLVPDKIEIIAKPSDPAMGTVIGGGNYIKDTIITLTPKAEPGYIFDSWDDGNKEYPREVKTVEKHEYVAIFKKVESIDLGTGTTNPTGPIKPVEGGNSTTSLSIQQEFDELRGRFDLRMKDSLTYENALALITGDYEALNEILRMLDTYPNQIADSRNNYIEPFQTRADEAIKKINDAVFSTLLTSSQRDEMYSKYIPQKNEIEKMRNSL